MSDIPKWHFGNAGVDGDERRGWFVGALLDPGNVRTSRDVEIRWGAYTAGDWQEDWFEDDKRTTVFLLVSGRLRIDLPVGTAVLAEQGDYAIWGPGIGHSWRAEEDSVVITIRWPSTA